MKYGRFQRDDKGEIKKRDLYPAIGSLEKIQNRLYRFLQQIELPSYAYGSVKAKDNIQNALQHRHNKYFLSVDLKNFFPNITHRQIFHMFRCRGFSPDVSQLLTKLTTYKGGLLQGPATSPVLANLVFVDTGMKLQQIAEKYNLTFTAYLDDLTFSSKSDFKHVISDILKEIQMSGFILNHKKIKYKTYFPEVTGIFIYKGALLVHPDTLYRAMVNSRTKDYIKRVFAHNKPCSKLN